MQESKSYKTWSAGGGSNRVTHLPVNWFALAKSQT